MLPRLRPAGYVLAGGILSAAALGGGFQPLALGLVTAAPPGIPAVLLALGAAAGYVVFWGMRGLQGLAWMAAGLGAGWLAHRESGCRRQELLAPSLAALAVAGVGVWFQQRFGMAEPVRLFLLRVAAAAFSAAAFSGWLRRQEGWARWAVQTMGVLALSRFRPGRYLNLGCGAAGLLGAAGNFPSAVLAGLALDLAGLTAVRMTGAMCLGWCLRRLPGQTAWWGCLSPGMGYVLMALLSGSWDIRPLPALLLGGAVAGVCPEGVRPVEVRAHTGEAAVAQVRLDRMALALRQMERSLDPDDQGEIDADALWQRACSEACDTCPERKTCRARQAAMHLPPALLEQSGLGEEDLPGGCRKPARLLASLHRGQERMRRIRGERNRLSCFRRATREQYGFLAEFLRSLSDDLATRRELRPDRFRPEVAVAGRSAAAENGDCCISFPGVGNRYYVLLCDGMGTGEAACRESREAVNLLRQMLCAGVSEEAALRSLNSLAILRSLGGCTTVDLLRLGLDTGRGVLYKWGAAGSWLLRGGQLELLGEPMPPPGVSQDCRESREPVAMNRGELLILHSDGAEDSALLSVPAGAEPGELAAYLLEQTASGRDDATVAVVRLQPV